MVLFKGKSSFKQYMPNKPTKRGYKVWVKADAINGYCCDIDIYAGATQGATQFGLGASVVKTMVEPLYGQGYFVFYGNFFSSIQLVIRFAGGFDLHHCDNKGESEKLATVFEGTQRNGENHESG
jgi:hypothetical protein